MAEIPSAEKSKRGASAARLAPLAGVVVALALGYAFGLHRYVSLEAFGRYEDSLAGFVDADPALAAAGYLLVYVAAVAVSFPGASLLTVAGGLMFGCVGGAVLAVAAATAGATIIFLIARTALGDLLAERAGPRVQRLRAGFREDGFKYLLFLRLVPLFPFWLVNLAAGLFGMRLLPYVAATLIGIVPATLVFTFFGEGLGTALDPAGPRISTKLFVGLLLLGALALAPVAIRKWRGSEKAEPGGSG
jgi:uncharacterized membrane protein YdjX (TVP38/TMEM64 family)